MLSWIGDNIGTIVISAVLVLIVAAVIINMIKDKKKGISPVCGGKCGSCPMSCRCCGSGNSPAKKPPEPGKNDSARSSP